MVKCVYDRAGVFVLYPALFFKKELMKTKMLLLFIVLVIVMGCAKEAYKHSNYRREYKGCHFFVKGREKPKRILPAKTKKKLKRGKKGKTPKSYDRW